LVSRYNVQLESYCKTINIEALLTSNIATTMILPAALAYQAQLAETIIATKSVLDSADMTGQESLLKDVTEKSSQLKHAIDALDKLNRKDEKAHSDPFDHAKFYETKIIPAMNEVRTLADELESLVDDSLWPLPKFREMLYIY